MDFKTIKFKCKRIQLSSSDHKDSWKKTAHKYSATIIYCGKHFSTPFYTGSGWTKEPDFEDVMGSLLSEMGYAQDSFGDFCSSLGYDTDSRSAYSQYRTCKRIAKRLSALFTETDLSELYTYLEAQGKL